MKVFGIILVLGVIALPFLLLFLLVHMIRKRRRREAVEMADFNPNIYAGFWRRLAALIIDSLILMIPFIASSFFMMQSPAIWDPTAMIIWEFVYIGALFAYYAGFLISPWQATPGKRLMGVFIVSADTGGLISPAQAIKRYLVLHGPTLLFSFAVAFLQHSPTETWTQDERQEMATIMKKRTNHEPLSEDDLRTAKIVDQKIRESGMRYSAQLADLTPEESERLAAIEQKREQHVQLTQEEQEFSRDAAGKMVKGSLKISLFAVLLWGYFLVAAVMVGTSHRKTGPHDRVAGTLALRGRTQRSLF